MFGYKNMEDWALEQTEKIFKVWSGSNAAQPRSTLTRHPLRFRLRVVASNVEARFDRALTGTYLHDLPEPDSARLWDKVYRTVLQTGEPQSFVGEVVEDGVPRRYRAVIWPLASNHRDIDMLLCCREPLGDGENIQPDTPETWGE